MKDEVRYYKCACQFCGGHIEFEAEADGLTVDCPHCDQKTQLAALPEKAGGKRNQSSPIQRLSITSKIVGCLLIAGLAVAVFVFAAFQFTRGSAEKVISQNKNQIAGSPVVLKKVEEPPQVTPENNTISNIQQNTQLVDEKSAAQEQITQRELTERNSLDHWLNYVQQIVRTRNTASYMMMAKIIADVMNDSTSDFPEPVAGDRDKVFDLLKYTQNKLGGLSSMVIGYNPKLCVWTIHDNNNVGYIFLPVDLDPTSAQIITEPEQYDNVPTGRVRCFIRFTTRDNQKKLIARNSFGAILDDHLNIFCGFDIGDQGPKRIGTALAAIIMAYGGKGELVDDTLLGN